MRHPPSLSVRGENAIRPLTRQSPPPSAPPAGANSTSPSTTNAQQATRRFTVNPPSDRSSGLTNLDFHAALGACRLGTVLRRAPAHIAILALFIAQIGTVMGVAPAAASGA